MIKKKIKKLYKRLSVREKLLFLLFFSVILILWCSSLTRRISELNHERKIAQFELNDQEQWIIQKPLISNNLERALERVDPAKTYSATKLSGRIDNMIRKVGLQADIDPVKTREGEVFNDHDLRVRLNRISIDKLIEFNNLLQIESPYINLDSLRLSANKRKPEELDARFEINSFDLKAGAIQN